MAQPSSGRSLTSSGMCHSAWNIVTHEVVGHPSVLECLGRELKTRGAAL